MKRFDVYLITLDPTVRVEIHKTRPCLIISPATQTRVLAVLAELFAE